MRHPGELDKTNQCGARLNTILFENYRLPAVKKNPQWLRTVVNLH